MKKIILVLLLMVGYIQAQDVTYTFVGNGYSNTMTASKDTVDIYFDNRPEILTLSVKSTSGTDTLEVWTMDRGNNWIQKGLINITTQTAYSQIITTSAYVEYQIQDPQVLALRLITRDGSANIAFTLNEKEGEPLPTISTGNGNLEATQLQVLSELQNRTNLGGLQTYSSRRGDFTVAPRVAGKSVTITGASFTISANAVVYASKRTSGGVWSVIPISTVTDSVAGTSIRFDAMSGTFAATDVVDVMFVSTEKTLDKANDAEKSIEQAPIWARYQIDEIYDGTNLAAGTNYYPSSTGASMDGYKNLSFTSNLVDADGTITYTLEVTNDEDLTNATWMQVYGYDATLNATVNSLSVTNGTLNTAWDFDNLNCNAWRVKVVTSGSTNTIVIKSRRTY